MPSKDDLCFIAEEKSSPSTNQDFLSRDIDDLVQEIKDNLRLKAKPSHLTNSKTKLRASPYSVPSRTESKCGCCNSRRCLRRSTANSTSTARRNSEDPYEMLQDLLKEGDLIKEAVKRLQLGLVPTRRCVYYDSDEEYRTPPFPFKDVEV